MTAARNIAASAAALALAVSVAQPVVQRWEGKENRGYADRLAGNLPTACFGATLNIVVGRYYSDAECLVMLERDLKVTAAGTARCLPATLPTRVRAAFISLAYNIGVRAFCGSTVMRRAMAGDLAGACRAIDMWNKARPGGVLQVVRGLVLRRSDERRLCESGLA